MRASANSPQVYWRGIRNVELGPDLPDGFMAQGGTEQAPMSTTKDFHIALEYSAGAQTRLILKIATSSFMDRGAALKYLSAFPAEEEFLYPPLTYLKPTGQQEVVTVPIDGAKVTFHVVEVTPRFGS